MCEQIDVRFTCRSERGEIASLESKIFASFQASPGEHSVATIDRANDASNLPSHVANILLSKRTGAQATAERRDFQWATGGNSDVPGCAATISWRLVLWGSSV